MKQLYLILLTFLLIEAVNSESISPDVTTEFCPNTEYTFTVTISKGYSSISTSGGCYVTQSPTSPVGSTFTFKGKFIDVNAKQTFTINYTDHTHTDFEFKKIKSLFNGDIGTLPCSHIQPNISTINAPKCIIFTTQLTFPQLQYFTQDVSPQSCFGNITKYEYLLPAGWKLNTTLSDGSTVIVAGHDVTITSDASTGGTVGVRPSNKDCPNSTANGYPFTNIAINRPNPTFTISPASTQIQCTSTSSKTFTV